MYAQSLSEALTLNEIIFLKKQIWWTGCTETPYICRGGVFTMNSYVLVITDSRSVWVTKADSQQINEEKDKFNESIQIKFEDILKTLDSPLRNGRSTTQFTRLQFRKNKDEDLILTMEFKVGIYPFKWEFFLTKMDDSEIFNILVDDLVNPMAKTIISLEQRGNAYKDRCLQIEKELIRNLSEKERNNYRSFIQKDDHEFWSQFIKSDSLDHKLTDFDYGPATKYYLSHYNSINLISVDDQKKDNNQGNRRENIQGFNNDNNGDNNRMKQVQDYWNTLEDSPQPNSSIRPDSKKRYKMNDYEEEIPTRKQDLELINIKVNYDDSYEVNNRIQSNNDQNNKDQTKKKKKQLNFL